MKFLRSIWFPVFIFIAVFFVVLDETADRPPAKTGAGITPPVTGTDWQAPDITSVGNDSAAQLIRYGKELIINTAKYLGPRGSVMAISNGMNCQNCHIEAGAKPYGNCLSAVAATYPVFRPRSGVKESVEFRVNDCLQRSLNGKTIDSLSKEMKAMVAYITWLGKDVPKGYKPVGAGMQELAFIERAADPTKGKAIYALQCSRCHGANGEGQLKFDSIEYAYPPLWGPQSYNVSAGLYRISKLAAYAKDNMPFGIATHNNPQLSDEEAWDVAAFINSQPRPVKKFAQDWPDISKKSFDFPFGPYTDGFLEQQHKYGPFAPIKKVQDLSADQKK
ncbi:MAG TPA: c-type cytochrome [Chitinophagaceae bacterium]|nr:c-type cytochrome [Chitinophagaceae bacterium]